MMLPGVEVARKRRIHNHEIYPRVPQGQIHQPWGLPYSNMGESAMAARIRLDERLRRFGKTTLPSNSSSRWSQFMSDGTNTYMQQYTSTSKRVNQVEATQNPNAANSPLLKKLASTADELCSVCLKKVRGKKKVMRLPCSHKYHFDCVQPWLASHHNCPCCRTAVRFSSLMLPFFL